MFFKWEWEKEPNNICCCFLNWQADKHHKANRLLSLSQWNEERTGKKWKVELMGRDKNYSLRKERRIVVIITIYKHIYIYKTSKAQFNRSPPAVWCPTSLQAAAAPWPAPLNFIVFSRGVIKNIHLASFCQVSWSYALPWTCSPYDNTGSWKPS